MSCEKCGGKTGYIITSTNEHASFLKWNREIEYTEETGNSETKKMAQCRDCGKSFRLFR